MQDSNPQQPDSPENAPNISLPTPISMPPPPRSDFASVDSSPDPAAFVRYLSAEVGEDTARRRALSYALLEAKVGMRLLDVGCGIGDDVRALAQIVGATGQVIGLDNSKTMLAAAKARTPDDLSCEFILGDAQQLPFADATFDGCRAERVLIHSDDPGRALAEIARVVRSGGLVVVTEPDLDSLVFHAENHDAVRRLTHWHSDRVRQGTIGRRLPELFSHAGLQDVRIFPSVALTTTLSPYPQTLLTRTQEHGAITEREAEELREEWLRRDHEGQYLEYGVFFTVVGRKE